MGSKPEAPLSMESLSMGSLSMGSKLEAALQTSLTGQGGGEQTQPRAIHTLQTKGWNSGHGAQGRVTLGTAELGSPAPHCRDGGSAKQHLGLHGHQQYWGGSGWAIAPHHAHVWHFSPTEAECRAK